MDNLNFTAEQREYVEALLTSKIETEKRLKQEQLIVEDQKFLIEYLKEEINMLTLEVIQLKNRQLLCLLEEQ